MARRVRCTIKLIVSFEIEYEKNNKAGRKAAVEAAVEAATMHHGIQCWGEEGYFSAFVKSAKLQEGAKRGKA